MILGWGASWPSLGPPMRTKGIQDQLVVIILLKHANLSFSKVKLSLPKLDMARYDPFSNGNGGLIESCVCGTTSLGPPGPSRVLKKTQVILGWGAFWHSVCPLMVTNGSNNQLAVVTLPKNMQISEHR